MFEFTARIGIPAPPERVWQVLEDVQRWWAPSNPEHESLEILDEDQRLQVGTRIRIRERVAGIPGEAVGEITELEPGRRVTWVSEKARYRLAAIRLTVREGVTWVINPAVDGSELSAHVWAEFPGGWFGRALEWLFRHPLRGVEKDYQHAMTELRFLRAQLAQDD